MERSIAKRQNFSENKNIVEVLLVLGSDGD
jgi:hypothetical protein